MYRNPIISPSRNVSGMRLLSDVDDDSDDDDDDDDNATTNLDALPRLLYR